MLLFVEISPANKRNREIIIRESSVGRETNYSGVMLINVVPLICVFATIVAGVVGPDFSFGDAEFSIDYYRAAYNASSNCLVSPLSVRLAMVPFYRVAGSSADRTIQRVFYLPLDKSVASDNAAEIFNGINGNKQLQIAFKVLRQQNTLSDEFTIALDKTLKMIPDVVSFSEKSTVTNFINEWAERVSNKQIRNIAGIDNLDPSVELMLFNAVSLKASWAEKFPIGNTKRQPFAFLNGIREVDMMHTSLEVLYKHEDTYHAIQIPYGEESDLSMWILVPRGVGSFDSLMTTLSAELINDIEITAMPKVAEVSLPRFEIRSDHDAKKIIQSMGYTQLFSDKAFNVFKGQKSTLCGLRQSSFLLVDEDASEDSTSAFAPAKQRSKNTQFNVNQPFIFIIKKISSDTIVFIGHYSHHE
ncbi:neuroserpin-like [Toxorhynchites rutilus septentrionalis]|uniref:neuroserpin-like n=1 Tax=Toxorhynchites rutilus septentrionalis TaxID=329112 RepID=UPI002478AC9E|nr:neuroserpin-like [Toxorhynchites rutilus septentrionalis]